jgi:hypothetical protein
MTTTNLPTTYALSKLATPFSNVSHVPLFSLGTRKYHPRKQLQICPFIKHMKTVGAFDSPNGTTINSKCPQPVLNVVLLISSSFILA